MIDLHKPDKISSTAEYGSMDFSISEDNSSISPRSVFSQQVVKVFPAKARSAAIERSQYPFFVVRAGALKFKIARNGDRRSSIPLLSVAIVLTIRIPHVRTMSEVQQGLKLFLCSQNAFAVCFQSQNVPISIIPAFIA